MPFAKGAAGGNDLRITHAGQADGCKPGVYLMISQHFQAKAIFITTKALFRDPEVDQKTVKEECLYGKMETA